MFFPLPFRYKMTSAASNASLYTPGYGAQASKVSRYVIIHVEVKVKYFA